MDPCGKSRLADPPLCADVGWMPIKPLAGRPDLAILRVHQQVYLAGPLVGPQGQEPQLLAMA